MTDCKWTKPAQKRKSEPAACLRGTHHGPLWGGDQRSRAQCRAKSGTAAADIRAGGIAEEEGRGRELSGLGATIGTEAWRTVRGSVRVAERAIGVAGRGSAVRGLGQH